MPPMCRKVLHKRGDAGTPGVARGARRRPGGRQGGGLPDPPGGGTEVPVACPVFPAPNRPGRPATRRARRRRPERPRGLAVQPNKNPSPRDRPPLPPCGPRWERALHTPWPQHIQGIWLVQRTQRQCRWGTAHCRRTRRTTPYGSSHGTCATASSHQTGPSRTGTGGAGGRRPVPTRSTSSPACYPGEGALPSCSRETGIVTLAQDMPVAAALQEKGYTPFFSSRLAETGATSTSRGGGLLTAVSSKYVAEHEVFSFTKTVPGKAAALEIRTDGGGLTLINVHRPQAGCSPWAGRAAF